MQLSQLPTLLKLAFAALGGKNSIPVASQLPGNINGASYTDGFPPATRTAIVAGGKPPAGLDMNGVLFDVSSHIRWLNAGGPYAYDSGFATDANVGGYPQGAQIASADLQGAWLSLNDNNTDNPDTGAGTKWVPARAYGVTAIGGLTNVNVTLTPAQAAKNKITLAGTLTGNVQIILPTWLKDWSVTNNTTGAFTATCKTAAGTGIAIPQDGSPTKIVGDGTNITQPAENIAAATQSTHPMQLGQATGRLLGPPQIFTSSGTYTRNPLATFVIFEVQGAGGGSAGAGATAAAQFSGSPGASSGSYAKALLTAAQVGASQPITIGAAGVAGTSGGGIGGTGGTTTVGSLIACPGGIGSTSYGPTGATTFIQNAPAAAGAPTVSTGTAIVATTGNTGGFAIGTAASGVASAQGGAAPMSGSTGGGDAGAGGRGASVGPSSGAVAGVAGGAGKVIAWEYF